MADEHTQSLVDIMTPHVSIKPELLQWARKRAGKSREDLIGKFRKLPEWEDGDSQPTLKQLEDFAKTVHVPLGYLFFTKPPEEPLPIKDFRTIASREVRAPSVNLRDTITICQERQDWYRDYARANGDDELDFVRSATIKINPAAVAAAMRKRLGLADDFLAQQPDSSKARRFLIDQAEQAGVLVMISGVVKNNPKRTLDIKEFRGFALCDRIAPLIFVNGRDSLTAQIFTIAHELAHIWLGASGLSDSGIKPGLDHSREEIWCNKVAADFLIPLKILYENRSPKDSWEESFEQLKKKFKVSGLVILRRLLDAKMISSRDFDLAWKEQIEQIRQYKEHKIDSDKEGGNFFKTAPMRTGRRFLAGLIASTLEGQTLYRDALSMAGVNKAETLRKLGNEIETSDNNVPS